MEHIFKNIHEQIESLLENNFSKKENLTANLKSDSLSVVKKVSCSLKQEPYNINLLFSYLSEIFDSGFLLEQTCKENSLRIKAGFQNGRCFPYPMNSQSPIINLPPISLFEVKKTNPKFIQKQMQLQISDIDLSCTALAIKPDSHHTVILFTNIAEPWLQTIIEEILETAQFCQREQ